MVAAGTRDTMFGLLTIAACVLKYVMGVPWLFSLITLTTKKKIATICRDKCNSGVRSKAVCGVGVHPQGRCSIP